MVDTSRRKTAVDLMVVAMVVLLATGHGLPELGFYSDDWALVADMELTKDRTVGGAFAALRVHDRAVRPLQFGLLALLHRGLGTDPLPYHVAQFGLVLLGACLLFLVLRKLRMAPRLSLAIALVWAVLPHHSSARLWVAAAQVPLAAAAYFAHVLADLRAADSSGRAAAGWRLLSGLSALASLLAYELYLPLILATPFLTRWWRRGHEREPAGAAEARRHVAFTLAVAPAFAAVALALAAKVLWASRLPTMGPLLRFLRGGRTYLEIAAEHATTYGLAAPLTIARAFIGADPLGIAMAVLAGLLAFAYLRAPRAGWNGAPLRDREPVSPAVAHGARAFFASPAALVVAGLLLHFAGYAVGFLTGGLGTGATGVNNRTAMAASMGVAFVLAGLALLVARRSGRRGDAVFAGVVAVCVASAGIANAAITRGWVGAADRQARVMDRLQARLADVRGIDNLLIAGVCPFEGAGIVMESPWGVSGLLRLAYRPAVISGDVVAPETHVDRSGVLTVIYHDTTRYPFEALAGYDDRTGEVVPLADSTAAAAFVQGALATYARQDCEGVPGRGVPIF